MLRALGVIIFRSENFGSLSVKNGVPPPIMREKKKQDERKEIQGPLSYSGSSIGATTLPGFAFVLFQRGTLIYTRGAHRDLPILRDVCECLELG